MSDLKKLLATSGWVVVTGVNGYGALNHFLKAANTKAATLQTQLSNAPELTERVYQLARETAERAASGEYYQGLFYTAVTGMSLGMCFYYAYRKDKEE